MIYAMLSREGEEALCCVDKSGKRAFLVSNFFRADLKSLCIESNLTDRIPSTIAELILCFDPEWTDDMALFFGSSPELGIELHPEADWEPLVMLDEIWSPLSDARGSILLAE